MVNYANSFPINRTKKCTISDALHFLFPSYIAIGPCPMQEVVPSAVSAAVSIDTII